MGPRVPAPHACGGPGPCAGTEPGIPSPLPPRVRGWSPRAGGGWTAGKGRGPEGREAAAAPHCSSRCPRVTRLSRQCLSGSHMAWWGGRGHLVPLSVPRGPSPDIPVPPSPRLLRARPAQEEETRAARRHLLLLLLLCRRRRRRRHSACCCCCGRRRRTRRFPSRVGKRREPGGAPSSRPPAVGSAQLAGTMDFPLARAVPRLPRSTCAPPPGPAL